MKQVRKIATINTENSAPWRQTWNRRRQQLELTAWLEREQVFNPAQRRLLDRYPDHWTVREHPQRRAIELYIDPAVVAESDWTVIELIFER